MNNTSGKNSQKEQLLAKLKQNGGKHKFNEFFLSSKNPKRMLALFASQYESQLLQIQAHGQKQDFRQKFFKDIVLYHLTSKQYKRRKNAFYILNLLIQTDPYFAEASLKEFGKIKDVLFKAEELPNLTTLEMTADYLRFKVFVNSKVLDWIDKYSSKYPDLFIWKKSQSQYFSSSISSNEEESLKFAEKFSQLKIYRVIFERNHNEIPKMRTEFQKIKFECYEARKLMDSKYDAEEIKEKDKEEEEKKSPEDQIQDQPYHFEADMSAFVEDRENNDEQVLMFYEEDDDSTQIHNQESMTPLISHDLPVSMNIQQQIRDHNKFSATEKNLTLFRVIQDNKKSLERRFIPLLEMFKVEGAFFKDIQTACVTVAQEKKDLESNYKGKVKISKKEQTEFEKDYKIVDQNDILELQQAVDILLKQVCDLKKDLDLIQLSQDCGQLIVSNSVVILDEEEEDPDEQLFK